MTASRGFRATPRRVAELEAQIAEVRGELLARIDFLAGELNRVRALPIELARARLSGELAVLKREREEGFARYPNRDPRRAEE